MQFLFVFIIPPSRCILFLLSGSHLRRKTAKISTNFAWQQQTVLERVNHKNRRLKKNKEKRNPDAISVPPELDVRFWAGQCNSVLLLFLYGLYCDTALGT